MWFAVSSFFKCKCIHPEHPDDESLWEERIFLIQAETEEGARQEGERICKVEEHEYVSATGDLVQWIFQQVASVSEIYSLEPGSELFSRFLKKQEVDSLLTNFKE